MEKFKKITLTQKNYCILIDLSMADFMGKRVLLYHLHIQTCFIYMFSEKKYDKHKMVSRDKVELC